MCIRDYLRSRKYYPKEETVKKIADSLQYFPKSTQIYSASGCKRVAHKAELVIQEESDFENDNFFRDEL